MAKSSIIGSLRVHLGLDSAQFQTGLKNASRSFDGMAKKAEAFGKAAGIAVTAAAGAISIAIGNVINRADSLGYVADRLGVNVEALQELRHAADRGGMAVQNFDVAFRRFIRRSSEAAMGTGAAKDAFKELGVSLKDSEGRLKSSETLLADVADAMQKVQDPAAKLRLAFKMFDTDGAAMVNVLAEGSAGLNRMREEARNLGIVLSDDAVRGAQAFKGNLDLITKAKDGLVTKLTAHLLPSLELLSEKLLGFVNDEAAVQAAADGIGKAFTWVARQAAHVVLLVDRLRVEIGGLIEAAKRLNTYDFSGAWEAWSGGQEASARMRDELDATLTQMEAGFVHSQGSIHRRISAAFGDMGREAGEAFATGLGTVTKRGASKGVFDALKAEGERLKEALQTPLERYIAQYDRYRELLKSAAIDQETFNRAVAAAGDAFEKAEQAGKKTENVFLSIGQTIAQSFGSGIQGLIDRTKTLKDVVRDVFSQIASMMMNRAIQSFIGMLFPGSASILNAGGGFRGLIGYNANGTNNWRGGLSAVNERGGEIIDLPKGSRVIPHDVSMAMARAGRGDVNYAPTYNIDAPGGDPQEIARAIEAYDKGRFARLVGDLPQLRKRGLA